jgi:hypothetical protein
MSKFNFVLTFAGLIPFVNIQSEAQTLAQPFPGSTLIPTVSLSKVTFNGILVIDLDTNKPYSDQQLISEILHNPICSDLHFLLQPHWLHPTPSLTGPFSSLSFAFLDPNGSTTQIMAQSHLAMFKKAITFKKWQDRPLIIQCS